MKKIIYYASPFVIFPSVFVLFILIDRVEAIDSQILSLILNSLLLIACAIIGTLSPSQKRFDYVMTSIVPISFVCSLFISLLFDEGCDGSTRLSISHALNGEYYLIWLPIIIIMTAITFVASFRPYRINIIGHKKRVLP